MFLFVQVGSISSYILAQFEFYIDLELIRLCMLPSVRDMTSVGFRRSSFAFRSQWELISDGDVGLKVAYNGMRGPYVYLEEPYVGPRHKLPSALQWSFSTRAYARRLCSFSRIYCTICLSQKIFVGLRGPSVDTRGPKAGCLR